MSEPWFRHKEYGYGAGLPIHWKGWALLGAYVVVLIGFPWVLQFYLGYPPGFRERLVTILVITLPFLWVAKNKTEGGWRWRHGPEDEPSDKIE